MNWPVGTGASWQYDVVKVTIDTIWIDDTGHRAGGSLTNNAEAVCRKIWHDYPGRRIIYKDSAGNWDEMKHEGGRFVAFAPARDMAP